MVADKNVAIFGKAEYTSLFNLKDKIKEIRWLDNGEDVEFEQNGEKVKVQLVPFTYGRNLVVRVAKIFVGNI